MKKFIVLLFCLFLINCNKSENSAQPELKADLMEVIQEDKVISNATASPTATNISEKVISENEPNSKPQKHQCNFQKNY